MCSTPRYTLWFWAESACHLRNATVPILPLVVAALCLELCLRSAATVFCVFGFVFLEVYTVRIFLELLLSVFRLRQIIQFN